MFVNSQRTSLVIGDRVSGILETGVREVYCAETTGRVGSRGPKARQAHGGPRGGNRPPGARVAAASRAHSTLALSAVIASLLLPLVRLGERSPLARRWPRFNRALVAGFATLLGVAAVLAFMALVAFGLVGGAATLAQTSPLLNEEGSRAFADVEAAYRERVPVWIQEELDPRLAAVGDAVLDSGVSALSKVASAVQSNIAQFVTLLATPIVVFQFLHRPNAVPEASEAARSRSHTGRPCGDGPAERDHRHRLRPGATGGRGFRRAYPSGCSIGRWASIWPCRMAMLAALSELLPVVGTLLFLLLMAVAVGLTNLGLLPVALAFYLLIQVIQNSFVTPRLHGLALGLHPMGVLLSLAIFTMFFGFIGALVAAPVTGAAYRVLQYVDRVWEESETNAQNISFISCGTVATKGRCVNTGLPRLYAAAHAGHPGFESKL